MFKQFGKGGQKSLSQASALWDESQAAAEARDARASPTRASGCHVWPPPGPGAASPDPSGVA